jgi:tripartite motif-containing protein 23
MEELGRLVPRAVVAPRQGPASPQVSVQARGGRGPVLECRVCEDAFELHGEKIPRLLFCGHTLCHACLLRLPARDGFISCPFDRQQTLLASNGVWELNKNFALMEMIERIQLADSSANFSVQFLDRERELAVACDEVEEHVAVVYCTVCGSHLCEQCSHLSHATRTLAKHRRIPLSEKPREKPVCAYHTSHVMEFTCLEEGCASEPLMCYICKDYGRHKGHAHNLLELEAEQARGRMAGAVQNMKKFMEEMGETTRKLEQVLGELRGAEESGREEGEGRAGTAEGARRRVRGYFQQLRDQLCVQEVAALTVVDSHVRERLCSIRQQEEDIAIVLSQVAEVCIQCDRVVRQDDARVLLAAPEIDRLLVSVEQQQQQFAELTPDQLALDSAIPVTFTKDNRVHIGPKIEMRVVTLGLDEAGKTSILFKLKQNEFVSTIPTIGFNVETLEFKNVKITLWDVGGQHKLRPLWKHYYLNTQAVIFVIDASDRDRLPEANGELVKLVSEKELKDACLLILANKQDVAGCASIEEITDQFSLYKLCCGRSWHIQACEAKAGTGLQDGLEWLSRQLVAAGIQDLG